MSTTPTPNASKVVFEHTVGSHSDDRGGDSDRRCTCQDDGPRPSTIPILSNCHQAPVNVAGSSEGTNYYICTECGEPCDPYVVALATEPSLNPDWDKPKTVEGLNLSKLETQGTPMATPTSENGLEQIFADSMVALTSYTTTMPDGSPVRVIDHDTRVIDTLKAKAAPQARQHRLVIEAQTNAVAWAIGQIDEMHMREGAGDEADRLFKGIKNNLRGSYESEVGVDPAPDYPVRAKLAKTGPQLNIEEEK